jgi:hypothetical protein
MTLSAVAKTAPSDSRRIVLHGVPGIGKSTFAADAPAPVFLARAKDIENLGGAQAFPEPESLDEVLEAVRVLTEQEHGFRTLVLDDLGVLNQLVVTAVCAKNRWADLSEAGGFGRDAQAVLDGWRPLLGALERLQARRSMSVVMLGHSEVKTTNDPLLGESYDTFVVGGLPKQVVGLLSQWAECVLFARYEMLAAPVGQGKTRTTSSGARFLHCTWTPGAYAKNRLSLPARIPLSWASFDEAVRAGQSRSTGELLGEAEELLEVLGRPASLVEYLGKVRADARKLTAFVDKLRGKAAEKSKES